MKTISQQSLRGLAAPNETHFVRLIIHEAYNSGRYTLRCRLRDYVFERDNTVGRHILDIPLSLWQKNAASASSAAAWRDNNSLAEDIRQSKANVSFYVLPYDTVASLPASASQEPADEPEESLLPILARLLEHLEAPVEVITCLDMIEAGESADVIRAYLSETVYTAKTDQPDASDSPDQSDTPEKVSNDTPPAETPEPEAPAETPVKEPEPAAPAKATVKASVPKATKHAKKKNK